MPSIDEFRAAGLYDPAADGDTDRLELLRWLIEQGFTLDELVRAHAAGVLGAVAADRAIVPGEQLTRDEAIEISGLDPIHFDHLATALGYAPVRESPPGEVGFTREDALAFGVLDAIGSIFTHDESLSLVRVFGASLTRMAEASVSLFLSDIETRHIAARGGELELALKAQQAVGVLGGLLEHLTPVLRRQVLQAVERTRRASIDLDERLIYRYAIGFVDLVGFTSLAGELAGPELATFLREFEARAFDVVTTAGARVVKLIGDEVMFAATDPEVACAAARGLMDAFSAEDATVFPRGGLAYGNLLVRGGDYYGSVVNLASRLVDQAVPQEVLVTAAFAEAARGCWFAPAGRRMVRGFRDPVVVFSLEP